MSKAIRFTLYADDLEQLAKFYANALGWSTRKAPPELGGDNHYFIAAGPDSEQGLNGDLEKRVGNRTTVNHFRVASFDETLKQVTTGGGKILGYTQMGDIGFHAFCQDPEGNIFGVFQEKSK